MTPAANSHPTADGPRFARWLVGAANNAGITTQSGLRSAWTPAAGTAAATARIDRGLPSAPAP